MATTTTTTHLDPTTLESIHQSYNITSNFSDTESTSSSQSEINLRQIRKTLSSKLFLSYSGCSFLFALTVLLTNFIWDYGIFHFIVEVLVISIELMVFTIFCLSHVVSTGAFFLIVGLGYGFVGIFALFHHAAQQQAFSLNVYSSIDISLQMYILGKYIEVPTLLYALYMLKR